MDNWQDYIESNPKVLFGKPVVKGTRVPVDLIFEKLEKSESINQLLNAYPRLGKHSIRACLIFGENPNVR